MVRYLISHANRNKDRHTYKTQTYNQTNRKTDIHTETDLSDGEEGDEFYDDSCLSELDQSACMLEAHCAVLVLCSQHLHLPLAHPHPANTRLKLLSCIDTNRQRKSVANDRRSNVTSNKEIRRKQMEEQAEKKRVYWFVPVTSITILA
jgi:hypothetical protein